MTINIHLSNMYTLLAMLIHFQYILFHVFEVLLYVYVENSLRFCLQLAQGVNPKIKEKL